MIEHGTQKAFNYPPSGMGPAPLNSLMGLAALIEITMGFFFLLGLFTRISAFILCGEMAFAYFMVHAPKGPFPAVNQGDAAVLFCFIFLYYCFAGGGSWSLDAIIEKQQSKSRPLKIDTRQTALPKT
jgi:putative oxidoreductase